MASCLMMTRRKYSEIQSPDFASLKVETLNTTYKHFTLNSFSSGATLLFLFSFTFITFSVPFHIEPLGAFVPFPWPFPGDMGPPFPGDMVPPLDRRSQTPFPRDTLFPFPGDLVFPFPGDLVFPFPGDLVFPFPGDLVFPFPGDLVRIFRVRQVEGLWLTDGLWLKLGEKLSLGAKERLGALLSEGI